MAPLMGSIDDVREGMTDSDAALVAELLGRAGVTGAQADQVVCLLRDDDGGLAGLSWAYPDDVPQVGGRRFWIYNSVLPSESPEAGDELIARTHAALAEGFDSDSGAPIGLCVLVHDRAEMERRPEAEWTDPTMIYAGYREDGAQVRIGYFPDARI